MLGEEIDEGPHPRRQRAGVTDIDRMDVLAVAGIEGLQHRHQAPGLDVGADVEQREPRKPDAAERKLARGLAIAGACDRRRQCLLDPLTPAEWPATDAAWKGPADAAMAGEVGRRLRRAEAGKIGGAATTAMRLVPSLRAISREAPSGPTRIATSARSCIRSTSVSVSTMSSVMSG